MQALRTATLNPAGVMEKRADFGSIAAGRVADLVILDANPLEGIGNTRRIAGVVTGGTLLRRGDLDTLLQAGEEMANRN